MSPRDTGARCGGASPPLTAREVWRLATTLEAPPAELCDKRAAAEGFALDDTASRWQLVPRRRDDGDCAFVIALASGKTLCGLGALAPAACGLGAGSAGSTEDAEHHAAVVAAWNALVARRGGRYLLETFTDYLMNACADEGRS